MTGSRVLVCPVLVARDELLDLASRRIEEVAGGTGRFLLLAGEAGLGKSRLLGAIRRRAAAAGFAVHGGGTYPSDLQVTGAVLLDLARAMQRTAAADLGARLEARLDAGPTGSGDAHRRRRLFILDIAELLVAAAAEGPTVIALEDLQWADDLTLEILEAVAGRLESVPLLVVATYRSDELYPRVPMRQWRARLVGRRLAEEVRLRRLTLDETGTMLALLAGDGLPAPRPLVEAVHVRSDGIPLHVEELIAALPDLAAAAEGTARGPATGEAPYPLGTPALTGVERVPETLDAAVAARLDQRSRRAIDVARAGAVIGRSFDVDLLAAVTGATPDALAAPLAELTDHFLLQPVAAPGRYGFRHALICDVIYEGMPDGQRRRLHDRTADAAAARPDVGTDAYLALHYERAGRRADAFRAASAGAAAAAAMSAHAEARELSAIALRTAPHDLAPLDRGRLLEAYGDQAAATDANETAAEAYDAARAAYLEGGDALAAAAVVAPLEGIRHLLGERLEGRVARLRAALATLDVASDGDGRATHAVRARLTAQIAAAYMLDRRLDEAMAAAHEARRFAAIAGDAAIDRNAATTLGCCEVFAGRMDDGWARLEDAIERSRAGHLEAESARGYRMLGSCASVLVEYERAERWLREGITLAERVELWNHRHYMAAHLAHVLWATGRWEAADAVARQALADGRGGITTRITALHVLGYLAMGRGDPAAARTALDEARALGEGMGELQRLSPALWGLAESAVVEGRPAAAIELVERGFAASAEVADAAYLFPFTVTGTRAYLAAGDPSGARSWVERVTTALEARAIPGTLPAVAHARGLLALADGRTAIARDELRVASDAWTGRDRAWEAAWASLDLARALDRAHLPGPAGEAAAVAARMAARLGSPVVAAAADAAADRRRRAGGEPWAPLTAREFEVARSVADGLTNAAIAADLGVSPRTVSAHVEHILAKLGVGRRAEIAAWVAARPVLHSRPHGDDREE